MSTENTPPPDLQRLLRWEDSGGTWRVAARRNPAAGAPRGSGQEITLSLLTCDGGEEMEVFSSSDPDLLAYVESAAL